MSTENLYNKEAIEKLRTMIDKIDIGMICTFSPRGEFPHVVPMSRQEVDEDGNVWYLFSSESETFKNLEQDSTITLAYSMPSDYLFVSVNGKAEISSDQSRIDKYWNKMMEGWFEKGKEDPRIRILKVNVLDAHYWDTKSNKLITLLKVASNAITGSDLDTGREGDLNL